MQTMELKNLIENNTGVLLQLQKNGVKNINVALDYLAIYKIYESFSEIKSKMERIELTADKCKIHSNSVRNAIKIFE